MEIGRILQFKKNRKQKFEIGRSILRFLFSVFELQDSSNFHFLGSPDSWRRDEPFLAGLYAAAPCRAERPII